MYWSEWTTSVSRVIFPQHIIINHSNNTLSCKAHSGPRDPPSIAYMTSFWATFPSASALISLSIMLPLYTPSFSFPSHPPTLHCYRQCFRLFPLTVYLIQSKLLHSFQMLFTTSDSLVVCLSITPIPHHCMLRLHYTIAWQITILLSLPEPFSSNISAPIVVSAWHFPSPAKCPFVINFDLTFLVAIPPPSLSQHFFPTFPLHLVLSPLNIIMFIYPQPLLHYCFTIFQCADSSSLLHFEWSALCVCVWRTSRPGSYVSNSSSSLAAHSMSSPTIKPVRMSNNLWEIGALLP